MQFIVKATTACNFQCVYCSEGDRKEEFLAEDVFCKLVDEIVCVKMFSVGNFNP